MGAYAHQKNLFFVFPERTHEAFAFIEDSEFVMT